MRQSKSFIPILKNVEKNSNIFSSNFLVKGGYVTRLASGIYTYLPLGVKVLNNISKLLRNEFNAIGSQEILMPSLHPLDIWKKTGRDKEYKDLLFKLKDRQNREFVLGPTHEEIVTELAHKYINSYKQLPLLLYQIQTKYRDELRPKYVLMRTREFSMFDAYSFSSNVKELNDIYHIVSLTFEKIFSMLDLSIIKTNALIDEIGAIKSEEFMLPCEVGDDLICFNKKSSKYVNKNSQVIQDACDNEYERCENSLELAHIFKLGTRYSEELSAKINDIHGLNKPIQMACYGIGVSRLLVGIIENKNTNMKWPSCIAPYQVHILISTLRDKKVIEIAEYVYKKLLDYNLTVLLDDRDMGLAQKLKDSEYIAAPYTIVVKKDSYLINKELVYSKDEIINFILDKFYINEK